MKTLSRRMAPMAAMVATAAVATGALAPVSTAMAAAAPLFTTIALPAVPSGAAVGATESATLTSISCTSPGDCVAGGSYRNSAGGQQAMIETETAGVWGAPHTATLPAGATTQAKSQSATINSVSCPILGYCVAVGTYRGTGNGSLVVAETDGVWGAGTTLASVTGEVSEGGVLDSVSCTAAENCVAAGTVATGRPLYEPAIATETTGTWSKPSLPTVPAGDLETLPTTISVSCPAPGDCVAVGTDYAASGPELPLIIGESGGHWQLPVTLGPLSGVIADPDQTVSIGAIDCAGVGQCTAVGNDETASGPTGFALVDSGGGFTEVGLPYPAGAAGFLAGTPYLGLDAVACGDVQDCAAAGGYPTAGTPTDPDGAPMTAVEGGGLWSSPVALSPPAGAAGSGISTMRGMSCPVAGQCEGVGSYATAAGQQIPLIAVSVPVLAVTSASLPAAQLGRPYSAQLSASGAAGAATWSVSAGTLPIGLSLNPSTGVISGTPRFIQRSSFTVTVSDPGPPGQSANMPLAIDVSANGPPAPRLSRLTVSPRRASAAGRRVGHRCEALTRRNRHRHHCRLTVRFSVRAHLSQAATVRLTATRVLPGRVVLHRDGLRCRAPSHTNRHDPRCTRTSRVRGALMLKFAVGTHTVRLVASFRGHALVPGTYRLRLVPSADRRTGRAVTTTLTITG